MGWLLFALAMVGFVALGFLLDRVAVRVTLWNEDRKIHKILADEVVQKFRLERLRRNGEDPL